MKMNEEKIIKMLENIDQRLVKLENDFANSIESVDVEEDYLPTLNISSLAKLEKFTNRNSLTFNDLIYILNNELYTYFFVGYTVKIPYLGKDHTWLIADFNHDNCGLAYDLICIDDDNKMPFREYGDGESNEYKKSNIKRFLENKIYRSLPEEILDHIKINTTIYEDGKGNSFERNTHIINISMSELGADENKSLFNKDGSVYNALNINMFKNYIWTRTPYDISNFGVWFVFGNTYVTNYSCADEYALAPIIRVH